MIRSKNTSRNLSIGVTALVAAAALCLVACSAKKAPAIADSGEAVAKVNGDELSAAQLQIALQKQRGMRADMGEAGAKIVLDQLIEEQLIAQKAVAAKLDQDPRVLQQLEAARRDILARRFIEAAADTAGKPTDEAVQKFFDARPALFGLRRVYTLQRTDVQVGDDRRAEVDARVRAAKSPAELAAWLKSQNLKTTVRSEQQATEQLPADLLAKVSAMKDGESIVLRSQAGVLALTLVSSVPAPKTLAEARPAIEQFLANQGRREVIVNLQKTIRDGASIEYLGRFAALATAGTNSALPAASAPASAAAMPVAASAVAAPIAASAAPQSTPAKK